MRLIIIPILLLVVSLQLCAQVTAVTEKGDTVVLLEDGRWDFIENHRQKQLAVTARIDTNQTIFSIPLSSKKVVKDLEGFYEVWYNEDDWTEIDPKLINPMAQKAWVLGDNEGYAMLIFEQLSIGLEELKNAAIQNAENAGAHITVSNTEYRWVNDQLYLSVELSGKVSGFDISYIYYFATTDESSFQFITFSDSKVFDKKADKLFELLNGFVVK